MGDLAWAAGVNLDIKTIRHYTASQLAEGFDLGNTEAVWQAHTGHLR